MAETLERDLKQMGSLPNLDNDRDLLAFVGRQYGMAKQHKQMRANKIKENIDNVRVIERTTRDANSQDRKLGTFKKNNQFYSPILSTTVAKRAASGWIPEITFEPEQKRGSNIDIFLAKNASAAHDLQLRLGGFHAQARKAVIDLFVGGRCFIGKGWTTTARPFSGMTFDSPTHIKYQHYAWKDSYWTKDGHSFIYAREYTPDELISEVGLEVLGMNIKTGSPFGDETSDQTINWERRNEEKVVIGGIHFWNDTQKIYTLILGGGKKVVHKFIGEEYPWTDYKGVGFIPVDHIDAGVATDETGDHPLSDIDKISDLWKTMSVVMNASISRVKKAAMAPQVFASDLDPEQARKMWRQNQANWMAGYDIPFFMKTNGVSGQMLSQNQNHGVDLNGPIALRDMIYEEMMIATGINYRAISQGAPTAEQEKIREQREVDSLNEVMEINEGNWQEFARTNIAMLQNTDSEFLEEHLDLEDEVSSEGDTFGQFKEGKVSDVLSQFEDFPFNVRVAVNNNNSKRKSIERFQKEQALNAIAPYFPGSKGVAKMALELASQYFPNLNQNDFMEQDQEEDPNVQGSQGQRQQSEGSIPNTQIESVGSLPRQGQPAGVGR